MSSNIIHEARMLITVSTRGKEHKVKVTGDPRAPSGKGSKAKRGKRERKLLSGTIERQPEEGSLNCPEPRARMKPLTRTYKNTVTQRAYAD